MTRANPTYEVKLQIVADPRSLREISKAFNVSTTSVRKYKTQGIEVRKRGRTRKTPETKPKKVTGDDLLRTIYAEKKKGKRFVITVEQALRMNELGLTGNEINNPKFNQLKLE